MEKFVGYLIKYCFRLSHRWEDADGARVSAGSMRDDRKLDNE